MANKCIREGNNKPKEKTRQEDAAVFLRCSNEQVFSRELPPRREVRLSLSSENHSRHFLFLQIPSCTQNYFHKRIDDIKYLMDTSKKLILNNSCANNT